ncbi:hypothetical protein D2E51_17655 [Mycobacteroides abscessus]|uniref:Tail terminator n=1 Tax=Mycobacteroides abscessus TaxID=36809 RepID=A0AB33TBM8_9MYCO|nr:MULTISPECIES: hypothetical protein [Mycobacteroides]WJJ56164.1 tail terminator [Mycobacterium phage prophiT37-1]AMU24274.1 hypothetical protein A3N96_01560 [Mycobacteroides abscessus]AMU58997.1 hypothetical protein A3O03_01555 [Mycobacteroides abscessus]AMU73491.1 hypothetical protein A3O06_01470 [Mycobacteroides abscessus]ANO22434.1 hypothetical protein BAB79_01470 [Mycobacteroides abscessus]
MPALYPAMLPADMVALAVAYLTPQPALTVPVGSKLPPTRTDATLPDGFLRVEFGGGSRANLLEWDLDLILFGYHPDEVEASNISRTATALMDAATGLTIDTWYVVWARATSLTHESKDPNVATPRYRSMVTWRVQGQPIGSPITP